MNRTLLGVAALVAGLSGCATPAKDISFDAATGSGVVAIPANTDAWPTYNRSQAMALIQSRVGADYEIVEEREVVTGQTTSSNRQIDTQQTVNPNIPILPAEKKTISDTQTTRDVTEYRIAYRKKAGGYDPRTGFKNEMGGVPANGVRQAQFQGDAGGVQNAGGLVPSVAPGPIVRHAGGINAGCPDGKCPNNR